MKITLQKKNMKTLIALLFAAYIFVGCQSQDSKNSLKGDEASSIDPKDFPAYENFGVEGYYGRIDFLNLTQAQKEVQGKALDFWFETSDLLSKTKFMDAYVNGGSNAYMDSLEAYFEDKLEFETEEHDYYWSKRYTTRAKTQILAETPCDVETPAQCKDRTSYHKLSEQDQEACDKWRHEMNMCRDIWFHCPQATFFNAQRPEINGNEAKIPLQLYEANYDDDHQVKDLNPCKLVNLFFVLENGQWMFDHREFLN